MGTKNKELLEAFINSGVSADHYTAYKAGAAFGYLMAKRQVVEAIDKTAQDTLNAIYMDDADYGYTLHQLEDLRDYVRNVMLWRNDD